MKKILSIVWVLILLAGVSGCASKTAETKETASTTETAAEQPSESEETDQAQPAVESKHAKIGIALYQDSGKAVTALKNYLESLQETLNVEFVYTVFSVTDEATNLTKIQELISSGVNGIIATADLGTPAIIAECEAAGVYYGGYISDFDVSYNTASEAVFGSDYFVGTAADGQTPDAVNIGTTMFDSLMAYNDSNPDAPISHVSFCLFPVWAFPSQMVAAEQFKGAVEDYNKTAALAIVIDPIDEGTDVLPFSPLDSTYFTKHPDTQAIISLAAGTSFVYPTMVSAGVDDKIKLFTTGYEGGEEANFGTVGKKTYQQVGVSAIESVNYALVLILNKVNGVDFKDMPEQAERVSTSQMIINNDEKMKTFTEKSMYFDGDAAKALFTAEDVLNMTAYGNPDATYADLKEMLAHLTIEDLQ